ncbi:MAG: hypothetical protein NW200_05725, partial [Hyphomonadaceae bacterium]|nr:hypothetical protein [Hyphomonadaceae bacterium]
LAAPAPYARKLARRMAHRRELAPAMLLAMRRHRPRRHLRRVLAPLFGEPPELLVGMVSTPPPRAGPYAVTLPPDLGRPLAPAPRASARRLCAPAVTQAAAPDDVRPAAQRRRA